MSESFPEIESLIERVYAAWDEKKSLDGPLLEEYLKLSTATRKEIANTYEFESSSE